MAVVLTCTVVIVIARGEFGCVQAAEYWQNTLQVKPVLDNITLAKNVRCAITPCLLNILPVNAVLVARRRMVVLFGCRCGFP